jgi:hypothetical protein
VAWLVAVDKATVPPTKYKPEAYYKCRCVVVADSWERRPDALETARFLLAGWGAYVNLHHVRFASIVSWVFGFCRNLRFIFQDRRGEADPEAC